MTGVPIDRRTGSVAMTPFAVGYATGADGQCLYAVSYSDANHRDEYRKGWLRGYRASLSAELDAYNAEHGTTWEPRT